MMIIGCYFHTAGGWHTLPHQPNEAVEFPGGALSPQARVRVHTLRRPSCSVERLLRLLVWREFPRPCEKNLYQTCPSQEVQVCADFVQLVLVLHRFCTVAQLFSPRIRATFEWKLKYENAHTLDCFSILPAAGSKGLR